MEGIISDVFGGWSVKITYIFIFKTYISIEIIWIWLIDPLCLDKKCDVSCSVLRVSHLIFVWSSLLDLLKYLRYTKTWPCATCKEFQYFTKGKDWRLIFQGIKVCSAPLYATLLNHIMMLMMQIGKRVAEWNRKFPKKLFFCQEACASIPRLLFLFLKDNFQTVVSSSSCFNEINCLPQQSPWWYSKKERLYESSYMASVKPVNQAWNITLKRPYRSLLFLIHLFFFLC